MEDSDERVKASASGYNIYPRIKQFSMIALAVLLKFRVDLTGSE